MSTDAFKEPDIFKSSLKLSLIAHVVIALIFTVRAYFFTAEPIDYSAAVRVDIVALPEKLNPSEVVLAPPEEKAETKPALPEKAAPAPAPKPVVVEKAKSAEPEAININKTKNKQSEALEKLKRQAALDKIKDQLEKDKQAQEAKKRVTQVKGNIISPGTALTGLNKLQHENYVGILDQHIKQHWALPEWLAKRDLKARARVRIGENGQILSREIIKSSGNGNYDDIVLETIDRSVPFPVPPEKFSAIVSAQGIVIGFPE